ncbi:DUF1294 domain-containing protein [Slackia exigua]|uniref:DUF1294 domain-containing protein n=1 Tax=Slackia exigua TaxID=84109 RepID=UPI00254AB843|nr:DUF1294 domain-containing protein [Slackia exigua]MDK7723894.1 DUF1294 domain-containing protein [Slackia exigua]MDK7725125.1 DUF1294 domain-containing protein [Slackia exigua]
MEQVLSALSGAVQGVHPFVIYLAGINALTFILFTIDYAIARYNQDEDTGLMDGRVLTLLAVAGGALGMLLALMLFTRNHMNKHNIAWWFNAIVFLIVWVLVVLVWAGVIVVDLEPGASFNAPVIVAIDAYLLAVNVITFAVFCLDKKRAIDRGSRLPEATLLGLSLAGGPLAVSSGCASPTIRRPSGISRRGCPPSSSCTSRCFFLPTAPGLFRGASNENSGQHADDPISRFCFSRHRAVRMRQTG